MLRIQADVHHRLDAALTALAHRYHAGLVLDVEHGFTGADLSDWIHPTALGYLLFARRVEPAVLARLRVTT